VDASRPGLNWYGYRPRRVDCHHPPLTECVRAFPSPDRRADQLTRWSLWYYTGIRP